MLHLNFQPYQFSIDRGQNQGPILTQHARAHHRPYIHPIVAPDGVGVLTEDAPPHHPWQHGLYVGLNDVNGVGFWTEGLRGSPLDGSFHPQPLTPPQISDNQVSWVVSCDWHDPTGASMLNEQQKWSFVDHGNSYLLHLHWSLHAAINLTFGPYSYGGLFLRMPFRPDVGGEVINSEGQTNSAAEGQPARWVAVSMPLADRNEEWAGIAMFDHPQNLRHPTPWRVDNQLGIAPSPCIQGAWQLGKGESAEFRYCLSIFCGRSNPSMIEAQWQQYY